MMSSVLPPIEMPLVPIVLFASVKGIDPIHFRTGQCEVVNLRIFFDVVGIAGAWDDYHALLQIPS